MIIYMCISITKPTYYALWKRSNFFETSFGSSTLMHSNLGSINAPVIKLLKGQCTVPGLAQTLSYYIVSFSLVFAGTG